MSISDGPSTTGLVYISGTGLGRDWHAAYKAAPAQRLTPDQLARVEVLEDLGTTQGEGGVVEVGVLLAHAPDVRRIAGRGCGEDGQVGVGEGAPGHVVLGRLVGLGHPHQAGHLGGGRLADRERQGGLGPRGRALLGVTLAVVDRVVEPGGEHDRQVGVVDARLGELGEPAQDVGEVLEVVVAGTVPRVEEVLAQRLVARQRPQAAQPHAQLVRRVVMRRHRPIEPHAVDACDVAHAKVPDK